MVSEQEYRAMLARATQIAALDPLPNSELGEELTALADALEEYERIHFPDAATPLPIEKDDKPK